MTNEQAKQEAIKRAYADLWPIVEEFTYTDSAKCHTSFYKPDQTIFDFRELSKEKRKEFIFFGQNGHVLPKSIQGIEDNNGWIRIEPDGSNLPTDSSKMYKSCINGEPNDNTLNTGWIRSGWEAGEVTHYKPIKEEPKPIY